MSRLSGEGGLRMMNFELYVKTQRVMWAKRLLYGEKNMAWKKFFHHMFGSVATMRQINFV